MSVKTENSPIWPSKNQFKVQGANNAANLYEVWNSDDYRPFCDIEMRPFMRRNRGWVHAGPEKKKQLKFGNRKCRNTVNQNENITSLILARNGPLTLDLDHRPLLNYFLGCNQQTLQRMSKINKNWATRSRKRKVWKMKSQCSKQS